MATTNTPFATIEKFEKQLENFPATGHIAIDALYLKWLLADAKHLNELNSFAIERRFEDAYAALKALADIEG